MDTQMHIRMFHPQTTRECLVLGRLYEKAHPRKYFNASWNATKNVAGSNGKGILSTPKLAEKAKEKEISKPKEGNQQLRKFPTNEEMSERRAKGLCYYCDEKYTPDHHLKH